MQASFFKDGGPAVGDVHVPSADWGKPKKKPRLPDGIEFAKSEPTPLYVYRPVLNADDLIRWAKSQGFPSAILPADMHVTVTYSRAPVDWMAMGDNWSGDENGNVTVNPGGPRVVSRFGQGAIVLEFACSACSWRNEAMRTAGASWDWPTYQPHITITYNEPDLDLSKVEPYRGKIVLGPEVFEPIDDNWSRGIVEKYDADQRRAPRGTSTGGQWVKDGTAGMSDEERKAKAASLEPVSALDTLGPDGVAKVQALIDSGASREELTAALMPANEMAGSFPETLAEDAVPTPEFFASRIYKDGMNIEQTLDRIEQKSLSFAGPDGPLENAEAILIIGPPAAGKSKTAEHIAEMTRSAIWDSDESKGLIPEFRGGIGAASVHNESKAMNSIIGARLMENKTNMIVPLIGHTPSSIIQKAEFLKSQGYKNVSLVLVDVHPDAAMARMASRYLKTGRLIELDYFNSVVDKPPAAYEATYNNPVFASSIHIGASGAQGTEHVQRARGHSYLKPGSLVFAKGQGLAGWPVWGQGGGAAQRMGGGGGFRKDSIEGPGDRVSGGEVTGGFHTFFKVSGVDQGLGLVFGWGIICNEAGRPYYDVQKNHIPEDAMVIATTDFMKNSRAAGDMHRRMDAGSVVHSFPLTADIAKAMGVASDKTGWMVALAPDPAMLRKFASGEYTGFSIGGEHLELDGQPLSEAA